MNQSPLLEIQGLRVDFKSGRTHSTAVEDISLSMNKGEVVAIVGESGSGKSVTALSILQLLPVPPARYTSGKILFSEPGEEAVNLLELSSDSLRSIRGNKISMIFQEPMTSLNPVYTCGNQVMEAIRAHRSLSYSEAKAETISLFEKVRLPNSVEMFHRYPHQLSGGQKQRVMIAMAMCCRPSILIADEPTTALDATVQKTILHLILELQQELGMGVIFISHDLGLVGEIAQKIIVMYRGRVVEQGSVNEIFLHPQHPYTKALLSCRPGQHSKSQRLPVVSDFLNENNSASEFFFKKSLNELAEVKSEYRPDNKKNIKNELVRAEHVRVWFPGKKNFWSRSQEFVKAVDDVSFSVNEGETLGLVGESGCGKTTLGRAILRLVEPTGGNIWYKNQDLVQLDQEKLRSMRKEMQIIFQDPYSSLNPRITIGNAIEEPMRVHGLLNNSRERREKVVDLLEQVNLKADHSKRYPHEFSGGQRQRICIARALSLSPKFIICDESVSALDVSVQAQVLNLLNDLKQEYQFTIIFISHDLTVVHYISDRIMVMNRGKIVEEGEADAIFNHPQNEYTQRLIDSIPKFIQNKPGN